MGRALSVLQGGGLPRLLPGHFNVLLDVGHVLRSLLDIWESTNSKEGLRQFQIGPLLHSGVGGAHDFTHVPRTGGQ